MSAAQTKMCGTETSSYVGGRLSVPEWFQITDGAVMPVLDVYPRSGLTVENIAVLEIHDSLLTVGTKQLLFLFN